MWWVWSVRVCWTVLFFLGITPNIIVLYCVLRKTPKDLRAYSVLLFSLSTTEIIASVSNWFIMERMIPSIDGLNFVAYGPCVLFGSRTCFFFHSVMLETYGNLVLIIPTSFIFRYYVLTRHTPKWQSVAIVAFVLYIPGFLSVAVLNQIYGEPEMVQSMLDLVRYADVHESNQAKDIALYGLSDIHSWQNFCVLMYIVFPWIPAYIVGIVFRWKILKGIQLIGQTRSAKTVRMHATLVKALTLQSCVPLVGVVAITIFLIAQVGIFTTPFLETSVFMITCLIPLLNGSISLYFVPHYRAVVRQWIKKPAESSQIITVVSSVNSAHTQ